MTTLHAAAVKPPEERSSHILQAALHDQIQRWATFLTDKRPSNVREASRVLGNLVSQEHVREDDRIKVLDLLARAADRCEHAEALETMPEAVAKIAAAGGATAEQQAKSLLVAWVGSWPSTGAHRRALDAITNDILMNRGAA